MCCYALKISIDNIVSRILMQFLLFNQPCTCTAFFPVTGLLFNMFFVTVHSISFLHLPCLYFGSPYEALFSSCAISSRVYVAQDGISLGCITKSGAAGL